MAIDRIPPVPPSSMGQSTSDDEGWNLAMQLLQGDAKLMDGQSEPDEENQFQDYLDGIQLYVNQAGSKTQAAFNALQTAYENYLADPSIGNSQIMKAISQLQANPYSLTDAQFKAATKALIEVLYDKVSTAPDTKQQEASDFMNLLSMLSVYSSQAPNSFVQQFLSSNTPLMAAYNAYAMADPPTDQEIIDLEDQLDNLKATLN